jgi:hypothetical protein
MIPADPDVSKCYDPTDDGYYYSYSYTIVSTVQKIQILAEFIKSKQLPEETAMRVMRSPLRDRSRYLRTAPMTWSTAMTI